MCVERSVSKFSIKYNESYDVLKDILYVTYISDTSEFEKLFRKNIMSLSKA